MGLKMVDLSVNAIELLLVQFNMLYCWKKSQIVNSLVGKKNLLIPLTNASDLHMLMYFG